MAPATWRPSTLPHVDRDGLAEATAVEPSDITAGLPADRTEWPTGVLDAAARFEMGHVVASPPLFYFADPEHPVWAATKPYAAASEGPEIVDADHVRPPYGLITTQTCDLGEIGFAKPAKPWFSVAPIYNMAHLNGGRQNEIRTGKSTLHWVHVPELDSSPDDFHVADLRLEVPIERVG